MYVNDAKRTTPRATTNGHILKWFTVSLDRVGLIRSDILLILIMVIHAVCNLHVFLGPGDSTHASLYVRVYWTGFGLPTNIVEESCSLQSFCMCSART